VHVLSLGTFHRFCASAFSSLTGVNNEAEASMASQDKAADAAADCEKTWYISESDLEFFRARVERKDAPVRADAWEPLMTKQIPGVLIYKAYRRLLKDIRKTEYLSTSITTDTSPHEVRRICQIAIIYACGA
jgi:hypothetical protein